VPLVATVLPGDEVIRSAERDRGRALHADELRDREPAGVEDDSTRGYSSGNDVVGRGGAVMPCGEVVHLIEGDGRFPLERAPVGDRDPTRIENRSGCGDTRTEDVRVEDHPARVVPGDEEVHAVVRDRRQLLAVRSRRDRDPVRVEDRPARQHARAVEVKPTAGAELVPRNEILGSSEGERRLVLRKRSRRDGESVGVEHRPRRAHSSAVDARVADP
jgi:hypothetical protein